MIPHIRRVNPSIKLIYRSRITFTYYITTIIIQLISLMTPMDIFDVPYILNGSSHSHVRIFVTGVVRAYSCDMFDSFLRVF